MVRVCVAAIVDCDRVFLSQRRDGDSFARLWEFPGGKQSPGDAGNDVATILRELREELGLVAYLNCGCPECRGRSGWERMTAGDVEAEGTVFELACYSVPWSAFVPWHPPIAQEVSGFGWFTMDQIDRLNLTPGTRFALASLRQAAVVGCTPK